MNYIDDAKNVLETHVGDENKESSLNIDNVPEFVILPLKYESNQACNKLFKKKTLINKYFIHRKRKYLRWSEKL